MRPDPRKPKHDRQARYDARNEKRGVIKVAVRIPEWRRPQLIELCAQWRREAVED